MPSPIPASATADPTPPQAVVSAATTAAPRVLAARGRSRSGARSALIWSLGLILLFAMVAVFAPLLAPYAPTAQLDIVGLKNHGPSLAHPFGTDRYSRDVLSRVLFGTRISLSIATLAVLLSATIGTAYGVISGYLGGHIDTVLMRLLDAFLAIPRVLLLVALLALWSPVPLGALIVIIGATGWFEVSRLVRAETMSVMQREHVLPNVATPVLVAAALAVGNVIILEAGLSYLGIGARVPTASWGSIFYDGSDALESTWWVALFPGLAILITVLAFNTLGDALRDLLDPRQLPGADQPTVPPNDIA
jgi:peptide/nickel transport system permease protein